MPLLVKRDRNHPSVVIWSICNEKLCNTASSTSDAQRMKGVFHALDPLATGGRLVSANSRNGQPLPVGPSTPLDVIGIDYTTEGACVRKAARLRPPRGRPRAVGIGHGAVQRHACPVP